MTKKSAPQEITSLTETEPTTEMDEALAEERPVGLIARILRVVKGESFSALERARELRSAVRAQDLDKVRSILRAPVDITETQEASLACIATRRQNLELLDMLIDAGVDVNAADQRSQNAKPRSPMQEAARKGWVKGINRLVEFGAAVDQVQNGDATALHIAARLGHPEAVNALLRHGSDPNGGVRTKNAPLHEAAEPAIVKLLLAAGADANRRDKVKCTPLHLQAYFGRAENVKLLIAAGGDVNAVDYKGRTPLFYIGSRGDASEVFDLLIDGGAKIEARDMSENTVAHAIAHRAANEKILSRLYQAAPDMWRLRNHAGESPLQILQVRGYDLWVTQYQNKNKQTSHQIGQ
jgi:ankyrin repeat protein